MKKVFVFLGVFLFFILGINFVKADDEQYNLKVLVIEINPILKTVQNSSLYHNNDGHPYVSEYFGQDRNKAVEEVKSDLEEMSHNYLNIEIVKWEYLDEFPTYTSPVNLSNGGSDYRYDEDTFISMARSSNNRDVGSWIDYIYHPNNKIVENSFDYNYVFDKFDVINRRINGEFDQVWLNTIDPSGTYETIMVGNHTYWINGSPIYYDCKNFMVANISISRRDANLHAYAHSSEFVLNMVFDREVLTYSKKYNDTSLDNYNQLSLWDKFSMTNIQSSGKNAGVGNVHFPFNGTFDYDYENNNYVYSNWKDWLNYPNLSNQKESVNSKAWLYFEPNNSMGPDQNKDPDRLYIRFWYYLMPHINGRNENGYYNNWWKYITTLEYVEEVVQNDEIDKNFFVGDTVTLDIDLKLKSGDIEKITNVINDNNVHIYGDTIGFENNTLKVKKEGKSILTLCYDGSCVNYNIISTLKKGFDFTIIFIVIIIISLLSFVILFIKKKVLVKKNVS